MGLGIRLDSLAIKSNDNRVEKRRNFSSLGMGKTAAYDVKCDVTGLKPAQFPVPPLCMWETSARIFVAFLKTLKFLPLLTLCWGCGSSVGRARDF